MAEKSRNELNKTKRIPKKSKGWPPERRQAQAERIRQTRPWVHSTGPKTTKGKARSAENALKHAAHSQSMNELRAVLREQRLFVAMLKATLPLKSDSCANI